MEHHTNLDIITVYKGYHIRSHTKSAQAYFHKHADFTKTQTNGSSMFSPFNSLIRTSLALPFWATSVWNSLYTHSTVTSFQGLQLNHLSNKDGLKILRKQFQDTALLSPTNSDPKHAHVELGVPNYLYLPEANPTPQRMSSYYLRTFCHVHYFHCIVENIFIPTT